MLKDGLYEQLINGIIEKELDPSKKIISTRRLAEEFAARTLSRYVAEVVEIGLNNCPDLISQLNLTNNLISRIKDETHLAEIEDYAVTVDRENNSVHELLSVYDRTNNVASINGEKTADRPVTSLVESSLFTGANSELNKEPQLFTELQHEINSADRIEMIVSFIRWAGIRLILPQLEKFTGRGGTLKIITTSYMGVTETKAVEELAKLPNTEIKICYESKNIGLHAKAYVFYRNTGFSTAYVGSSNLSRKAMSYGLEWNLKITKKDLPKTFDKIEETFDIYWNSKEFKLFNITDDTDRELLKKALNKEKYGETETGSNAFFFDIRPYTYQQEILDRLEAEREVRGLYRNLIIAATGTGKTVISAFDYRNYWKKTGLNYPKLLFVAHREEILKQSLNTFRTVLRDNNFGELLVGTNQPENGIDHLFVSIQSFNSRKLTETISEDFYDYIVVDEFHHAAAPTYQSLLTHFKPKILLGLTATPERMDGGDILKYFENRISGEIRLPEAIERGLLCPFQYFGVSDSVDLSEIKWTAGGYDKKELSNVYSLKKEIADRRADSVVKNLLHYAADIAEVKGLGFCVSVEHAQYMADFFNSRNIPSMCLTGNTDDDIRNNARNLLVKGCINFIFVVDIYNEGVDIPEINTILFLRPTESLTVFLQQLGRGLRLSENKDCLTVLDFIGQAHKKYNFEDKFRALLTRTKKGLTDEVKRNFPSVPKGCYITLEKTAAKYVLDNISQSYSTQKGIMARMAVFTDETGKELTLTNFLNVFKLSPKVFYRYKRSFYELASDAKVLPDSTGNYSVFDARNWYKIACINSRLWIDFLISFLSDLRDKSVKSPVNDSIPEENLATLSVYEKRMLGMFCISLWDKLDNNISSSEMLHNLMELASSGQVLNEVLELLQINKNRIDFVDQDVLREQNIPLHLYCEYTRDQILSAFDDPKPQNVREGVKYYSGHKTDILLVTLNKSDRDYSPSTMYEDYSINENLFHWQSQSTTSSTSATGQRYINHARTNNTVLLFVREAKNNSMSKFTENYTFLGRVFYEYHTGSKPMSIVWRLEKPIPSKFIKKTSKMMVG